LVAQTYTNLEIILIDDGSPDSCGDICDEYAKADARISVIHKENGGLSDARNAGIDIANGEYLTFVDSDDWIEPDMLETLYGALLKYDADISCCGFYLSYVDLNVNELLNDSLAVFDSPEQVIEGFLSKNKPSMSASGKLYRKHVFEGIRYPLNRRCEDIFIITDLLANANRTVYIPIPMYYYRQRQNSITHGDSYNPNILDAIEAYEYIYKSMACQFPHLAGLAYSGLLNASMFAIQSMFFCEDYRKLPEFKKTLCIIRKGYWVFLRKSNYSVKRKIMFALLGINVSLCKVALKIANMLKSAGENPRTLYK